MLHENLKRLRKQKGFSQEELAIRLHVVRQTVSKWEKGLSVPDADMLIQLAEVLETTVSGLLGQPLESAGDNANGPETLLAEQLSRINEQLAIRNRRARRIWKVVAIVLAAYLAVNALLILLSYAAYSAVPNTSTTTVEYRIDE